MSRESTNRWLAVAVAVVSLTATAGCGLLGWICLSIDELNVSVSALRKEVEIVKPIDVLHHVQQIDIRLTTIEQRLQK